MGFILRRTSCFAGADALVPWTKDLRDCRTYDWFLRSTGYPGATLTVVPEPLSIYYVESINTITAS